MAESEAIERQDCRRCGTPASTTPCGRHACVSAYEDGAWIFYAECVPLLEPRSRRAPRRSAGASWPRGRTARHARRRKQGYTIAGVGLCRTCSKRAQWNLRQPMLFATGWAGITRERVIEATR